jgi:hypothetical protein
LPARLYKGVEHPLLAFEMDAGTVTALLGMQIATVEGKGI